MDLKNGEVAPGIVIPAPSVHAAHNAACMQSCLDAMRDRHPKTIAYYRWAIRLLLAWLSRHGDKRVQDATREDIERLVASQRARLADNTVKVLVTLLRVLFRHLERNGHIFIDPLTHWTIRPAPFRMQPVPTESEMRRLLATPDTTTKLGIRDRALIETVYSTGARVSELLAMTIRDPDLDKGIVRVMGKGRKERVVPLGRHAVAWLRRYLQDARPRLLRNNTDEQALWLTYLGRPLHLVMVERIFTQYVRAAGIATPITPHAVRRACATYMLKNGAHPVEIQMLLGHASLDTLRHYLQVTIEDLKRMHAQSATGR